MGNKRLAQPPATAPWGTPAVPHPVVHPRPLPNASCPSTVVSNGRGRAGRLPQPAQRHFAARLWRGRQAAGVATTRYAGEYCWREAENPEMGGTLTVYPESDSTILFNLEANDGAQAYHIANAFGRAHLRGDPATHSGKAPEDAHGCRLKIGFSPLAARVALRAAPKTTVISAAVSRRIAPTSAPAASCRSR